MNVQSAGFNHKLGVFGGGRMAIFDKFKKMLISKEKQKKIEYQAEKQGTGIQDTSSADKKQMSLTQSNRQVRVAQLTPREHDLYLLLLEGFTLKESAKQLSIKYSTANTHMTGVYRKLGVKSRAELIINYRDVDGC